MFRRMSPPVVAVASWLLSVAGSVPVAAQSSLLMTDPDGKPVEWRGWLAQSAPAAVLIVATWAPHGRETIASAADIRRACDERGLRMVIVAVQEPFASAHAILGRQSVPWLHDRHGGLLKEYRVIEVPALLVLGADGRLVTRLEATPAAVAEWQGRPGG